MLGLDGGWRRVREASKSNGSYGVSGLTATFRRIDSGQGQALIARAAGLNRSAHADIVQQ